MVLEIRLSKPRNCLKPLSLVDEMLKSHALPEDWHLMSYADFLERRRELAAQLLEQLVLDPVAGGRDDHHFQGVSFPQIGMSRRQFGHHLSGLGEGQGASPGADPECLAFRHILRLALPVFAWAVVLIRATG